MRKQRKEEFFKQLNVSQRTQKNYEGAIRCPFVKGILKDFCGTDDLFVITNLKKLWLVYSYINLHPINVATHRLYSAAIMKYIRFINNGEKYGRRIDFKGINNSKKVKASKG